MSYSRRSFARALATGVGAFGAASMLPGLALASDLSLAERLDRLYSSGFVFDEHGEPRISIGLMQGCKQVRLTAPSGMRVLPSGAGGTAITAGKSWTISLGKSTPAKIRWSTAVESIATSDHKSIEAATKRWATNDVAVSEREVGGLFGVRGRLLDTRRTLLVSESVSDEAEARKLARTLSTRHGALGLLHPAVERRASGSLRAQDNEHELVIEAEGVLWFAANGDEPIIVHDLVDEHGKAADHRFRGEIYVAIDRTGQLCVVNLASETQVLAGLVPAEIYPSAPAAALESQAIAARGQLLAKVGTRHLEDPFLICAHQHCQVYHGADSEDARTTKAVHATKGRVLMRPGGQALVDTVFSANSGGHTEDNDHVWPSPKDPQLRGKIDPLAAKSFGSGITEANLKSWLEATPSSYSKPDSEMGAKSYRWREEIDPASLAGQGQIPAGVGMVQKLEVRARGKSGRATHLRVYAQNGEVDVHGELAIRKSLGNLRSSMFMVEADKDRHGRFVLLGGGHGHGVGMCQHGAMGMAKAGKSCTQILTHYYKDSSVETLW